MEDKMKAYEWRENHLRPGLPGVFSIGEFRSEDVAEMSVR